MTNQFIDKPNNEIVDAVQYSGVEENSELLSFASSIRIKTTGHRDLVTLHNFKISGTYAEFYINVGDWFVVRGTHFDILPDEYFHALFQTEFTKLENVANYYDKVNKKSVYITQYTGHSNAFAGMKDVITFHQYLLDFVGVSLKDKDEVLVIKPGTYVQWDGDTLETVDPKCFQFERLRDECH
jgi:hypothetical protein